MANELDELSGPVSEEGRDVAVIAKQIPVTIGTGSKVFEFFLWFPLVIPGLIFLTMKIKAKNYLRQLQQKIQHDASQIDNYLEQRVMILQNCAKLLDKAVELDKETFTTIAAHRSGISTAEGGSDAATSGDSDSARNLLSGAVDRLSTQIHIAMENYPDLKAHRQIEKAMQQNDYLQREITAAREVYNDTIEEWNQAIFAWPTKQIVAAKMGYTTRIPFSASKEIKEKARDVFF